MAILSSCSFGIRVPTRSLQKDQIFVPPLYHHRHHQNAQCHLRWSSSFSFLSPSLERDISMNPGFPTSSVFCTHRGKFDQFYTDHHEIDDYDDSLSSRFLSNLYTVLRDLYNGLAFFWKQPRELKYLEFPSLQSAGTMALFTIGVVMVLIIILASVDSGLGYFMARLFSRIS